VVGNARDVFKTGKGVITGLGYMMSSISCSAHSVCREYVETRSCPGW
jgi:hypothetical protein